MAKISAVTGHIVKQTHACDVVAPAYDALSPEERAEFTDLNPLSFLNTMRSAEEFAEPVPSADELLALNTENLEKLLKAEVFSKIENPSLFVYRLSIDDHLQTGLVAEMPIEEYADGSIRIHESTRAPREEQLSRYLDVVGASSSPVSIAFPSDQAIKAKIAHMTESEPVLDFVCEDGLQQTLWRVDDAQMIAELAQKFTNIPHVYLTDGHHRCAAGLRFANKVADGEVQSTDASFSNLLVSIFPDDELRVLAYHRAVRDLGGLTVNDFLEQLAQYFIVTPLHVNYPDEAEPRAKGEFAMFLDENWYRLEIRQEYVNTEDSVKSLDVSLLEDYLLRPILGIEDMRCDPRLDYLPGVNELRDFEERSFEGWRLLLGCYPMSMEEMYAVAGDGQVMPPKSTWFDPKVRSGIFLKLRQR